MSTKVWGELTVRELFVAFIFIVMWVVPVIVIFIHGPSRMLFPVVVLCTVLMFLVLGRTVLREDGLPKKQGAIWLLVGGLLVAINWRA